jgi:hypothetical protein
VIEVDDLPVGKFIQKLPIVSGAVSNADNRCLGKLFDYGAQLFAHFPEKRLLPALRRRAHINGVQTIAILVQQANGPSHRLLIPALNSQHTRAIDTNAKGFDCALVQVVRQSILPSLTFRR